MKIIVIGAGIVGAAIADRLSHEGADVTVLERAKPGAGASGNSFGWINASFAETDAYFHLRQTAIKAFRSLCEALDLSHTARWHGCLWWEDAGKGFERQFCELTRRGTGARLVDAAEFSRLEPAVANPPERAIMTAHEGAADGDLVAHSLLRRATENRATLITGCEVQHLLRSGNDVIGVQTSLGPLMADHVICATGAWSEDFLGRSGIALPMDNKPGLIITTAPAAPVIRHCIMSPDIHFRQNPDGRFTLGEIFSGGFEGEDAKALADDLIERLRTRLPGSNDIRLETIKLGLRPVPADGLPVIGPVTTAPGLSLAVMHSGITLAPLVGQLVADEVLGGDPSPLLTDFRPARFTSSPPVGRA
jgi:glycine/D-amino acid oxidase-like deaminating enzyme